MRRPLLFAVLAFVCLVQLINPNQSSAQNYISAVGNPSFGVNIPVPNGYINVANGNLHMEIPLANHKQRGALQLNEKLVYDSRIWEIVQYSNYYWWPINVPNSSAGWRFVKGNETGSLGTAASQIQNTSCWNGTYNVPYTTNTVYYSWTDPNGTVHPFEAGSTTATVPSGCPGVTPGPTATAWNGYATDASGYYATATTNAGNVNVTVKDSAGNQVYPQVIDRFGNFWTSDSNGNLVDDLGRTPVLATTSGNVTYYDVLAPNGTISNNGTRVRYTVTTEQITINTAFNQSGVTEYQGNGNPPGSVAKNIPAIQSVGLPDGSSYQFAYDSYGEIQSVTLPTGGVVTYGWANYTDSYQNVNRWLSSSTIAGSSTTYTPSVITQCSSNGTGCQEKVNLHRPSGDETVYTMTLNNGAWDTNTTVYAGAASANQAKLATVNTYDFSQACTTPGCNGAQNVTKTIETDSLPDANISSKTETDYATPKTGQMTALKQWDFYTTGSTPSSLPARQVNYGYTGFDLTSETHLDASGNTAASTAYHFTTTATATSGIVGHGTANVGGPYLTSVTATNNAPVGSITTYSTYEDTGSLLTSTDANNNPATTYKYDPTHTFVIEVDKPNTTTSGTTYAHVTKATFDPNSGALLSSDDENSVAHGQAYTVRHTYDINGRPYQVKYPDGGAVTYGYQGDITISTATAQNYSLNVLASSTVDGYGRAYQTTTGGITTTQSYDGNGRPYSVTTPQTTSPSATDGTTYTYYDALDRPSSVVYPGGATATIQIVGNTMTTKDEVGSQRKQTFNAFSELKQVLEPDPSTGALTLETDYQRDALGNLICVEQHGNVSGTGCSSPATSDATSPWRVRRFFYNSLSQLRAASIPEHTFLPSAPGGQSCGTGSGDGHWTDCYVYDLNGNLHARSDNRAVLRSYSYDALNRPLSETSATIAYAYSYDAGTNGVGLLFSQSNGTKTWSSYSYDSMGRVLSQASCATGTCSGIAAGATNPSYPVAAVTYDLAGNVTSMNYPDGRATGNAYDSLNRLTSVTYSKWGTQAIGTTYWSANSYAPPGELTAATYSNQSGNVMKVNAGFDARQSIASLSYVSSSSTSPQTYFNKTYQWDKNAANLLSETDQTTSHGRQYTYDKMNRLISAVDVTASTAKATATATISGFEGSTQDCSGGLSAAQSSTQTGVTPDVSKCTTIWDTGNVYITVGGFTVSTPYQQLSNSTKLATSLTALLNGSGSPVTATLSGTIITMTAIVPGTSGNYALSYSSDGDFNVAFSSATLMGGTSGAPVAGGLNQQYTLDAWGNLSSMGSSGFNQSPNLANQLSGYSYDAAGRLLGDGTFSYTYDDDGMMLTSSDGGRYTYDANGNRVAATNGTASKLYSYFGETLIATLNPSTNAWTDMIYAGGRIAEVAGTQTATPVYSVMDHLGSEVGSVGSSITSLDYTPFGKQISGSSPDSFIFTSLEHDSDGLDHAGFRQYSSASARWTIPDPYDGSYSFGDPQSLNRYSYVGNKPRAFADSTGLQSSFCPDCQGGMFYMNTNSSECDFFCLAVTDLSKVLTDLFFGFGKPSFKGNVSAQKQGKSIPSQCNGMSKSVGNDLAKMRGAFNQALDQMEASGQRLPLEGSNGFMGNIIGTATGATNNFVGAGKSLVKYCRSGGKMSLYPGAVNDWIDQSCIGQSDILIGVLSHLNLSNKWLINAVGTSDSSIAQNIAQGHFFPHNWVNAQYSNGPCSVNFTMDPWKAITEVH